MEITPKAMEIEYIRIKRFNLEREKAYATGTDAITLLFNSAGGLLLFLSFSALWASWQRKD